MKRSIVIFPEFSNSRDIQSLRREFDPLAFKIAPHITLVLPFESDLSSEDLESEDRFRTSTQPAYD